MTTRASDAPAYELKAEMFKALAHALRVQTLEVLAHGERSVSELQVVVGIEPAHLSQQLAVLRRAGLVVARKEGTTVYYSITDPLLIELLSVARRILIASLTTSRDLLTELEES